MNRIAGFLMESWPFELFDNTSLSETLTISVKYLVTNYVSKTKSGVKRMLHSAGNF